MLYQYYTVLAHSHPFMTYLTTNLPPMLLTFVAFIWPKHSQMSNTLIFLHINVSDMKFTGNYFAMSPKKTYKYMAKKIGSLLWHKRQEEAILLVWLFIYDPEKLGYFDIILINHVIPSLKERTCQSTSFNFFFCNSKWCSFSRNENYSEKLICYLDVEEEFMKNYYIFLINIYIFALFCIMDIWIYLFWSFNFVSFVNFMYKPISYYLFLISWFFFKSTIHIEVLNINNTRSYQM